MSFTLSLDIHEIIIARLIAGSMCHRKTNNLLRFECVRMSLVFINLEILSERYSLVNIVEH
jgi:hypothetical protein